MPQHRFDSGHVQMTDAFREALTGTVSSVEVICAQLLQRHLSGDWGGTPLEQQTVNEAALLIGRGIVKSAYTVDSVGDIWVLTSIDQLRNVPPTTYVMLAGQPLPLTRR